jgi:hypothetical protein
VSRASAALRATRLNADMKDVPKHEDRVAHQIGLIAALRAEGAGHVAERLARCMAARAARRRDAWPWRCRSPGCAWCGPPAARRWWHGLHLWAEGTRETAVTAAVVPAGGIGAVPRLRRALRDVRDRAAQADARWRAVAMLGMLETEGRAAVLVVHPVRLPRIVVERALRRRWPGVVLSEVEPEPSFRFPTGLAAALARARRGMEPLRMVVMPQRPRASPGEAAGSSAREPMPIAFAIGHGAESFSGPAPSPDTFGG